MTRAIMMQGTGSNVGKSLLLAGLARAFVRRGLSVAPFKPQNMSNNAAVTGDGGEIGRAQALQALAARRVPHTDMNPVLLKPESETGAQVIVQGQRMGTLGARDYIGRKQDLLRPVMESFRRLCRTADLVLVEGAGSPAEINLRAGDIANMGFAQAAGVPVILVGDIDRGGVIAQIVGTQAVLNPIDAGLIRGFAINKFRGDVSLFDEGLREIVARTGWSSLGVVPWFDEAWRLPPEDVMDLVSTARGGLKVAVPQLGRIANFDDLTPLANEPGVSVEIVQRGQPIPADAGLILLAGSKSTIADLAAFRAEGWDIDLAAHVRRGGRVLGICGGYQMLGRRIEDPDGIEGPQGAVEGLGHLDVVTVMRPHKRLALTEARYPATGDDVQGYEIHLGETTGPDCAHAWLAVGERTEGAASGDGRVRGTYLHGLFASDAFRASYLRELGAVSDLLYERAVEATLDALADHLERHMDLDLLWSLSASVPGRSA
ncbi:adenosylcobyric acid synthase (glutamine-hydrolysing) [Roseovarius azorensis]|uniref:Cobyric acid synthase n=1 Tax=Roseovarius azorensis TaxID=1287727 RepID=A0A1H7T615_9RHOB|nr:cobyric acid synthase [Roseovarius azorensis]SEL79696.1 adenosylcobyric acid synthase (glutamine-hydrolysing) [Roseovarius azorensis]